MPAALALCCSYSYCEVITGTTNNAAGAGLQWTMNNVLPQQAGLTVGSVFYRYTANKNVADPLKVSVQNENALGTGLIFRSVDDWSGLPGNRINKLVSVDNIDIKFWGNGSIVTEGVGTVTDPTVVYTYKYDTCYDPMTDPRCPGYAQARYDWLLANGLLNQQVNVESVLNNQFIKETLDKKTETKDEEKDKEKKVEEKKDTDKKDKKEQVAKQAVQNALTTASTVSQNSLIQTMNDVPNFNMYYITMPGGYYAETIKLDGKNLPDNRRGLRMGMAQQVLHDKLVESQYNKNNKGEQ